MDAFEAAVAEIVKVDEEMVRAARDGRFMDVLSLSADALPFGMGQALAHAVDHGEMWLVAFLEILGADMEQALEEATRSCKPSTVAQLMDGVDSRAKGRAFAHAVRRNDPNVTRVFVKHHGDFKAALKEAERYCDARTLQILTGIVQRMLKRAQSK